MFVTGEKRIVIEPQMNHFYSFDVLTFREGKRREGVREDINGEEEKMRIALVDISSTLLLVTTLSPFLLLLGTKDLIGALSFEL